MALIYAVVYGFGKKHYRYQIVCRCEKCAHYMMRIRENDFVRSTIKLTSLKFINLLNFCDVPVRVSH